MQRIVCLFVMGLFMTTSAIASGFGVFVQGAEGLGQGNAVIAHSAGASTVYFNPALVTKMENFAGVEIGTTMVNSDRSFSSELSGLTTDSKDSTYFPSTFYSYIRLSKSADVWLSLAVNSPFGLGTTWPDGWEGRYISTNGEITTFNVNPNITWGITDEWSVAFGLDFLYLDVDLNRAVPSKVFTGNLLTPDAYQQMKGDTWAYGWNAAASWEPTEKLALGFSYRSKFDIELDRMDVTHTSVPALLVPVMPNTKGSTKFSLPQQLTFGVAYDFTPKLVVEAAARWEDWAQYGNTTIYLQDAVLFQSSDTILREWKATMAYSLGGKYNITSQWAILAGFLYSETCVPDDTFDPSVPDTDANLYTIGGTYEGADWSLYLAYGLEDHKDRNKNNTINNAALLAGEQADGKYESTIHLIAVSVGYKF
jgi:long-chain fatty acid transport protein